MKTRRMSGRALLVTAAALALAAGCSGGGGGANAPGLEKTDLNVAVVPALDAAGFFVALYQNLFRAQGLNVHFFPATSSETVIADQVAGKYDITGGNYVSYIQAQQRGEASLDIIAEGSVMGSGAQGIYTMPNSPVKSLGDLRGHTIAINAPRNILYLLAASVLAEPFASGAEEGEGVVPLVDLNQGATTAFPVAGYVVTKQWAQRYPHTLAAFYKALEQGQQIADTSRAAVQDAMVDMPAPFGVSRETAAVMALDSYPVNDGPVGTVDTVRLE